MKTKIYAVILGLSLSSSAFAGLVSSSADQGDQNLNFSIDWTKPETLDQGNSIGCINLQAKVVISVPGVLNQDFQVRSPGGTCKLVSYQQTNNSSILTYEGNECFSDNDQNFFVDQMNSKGQLSGKSAALTADAGC